MTLKEFAYRMNRLTREEIAEAMERLPTDALEWAVKFEALEHREPDHFSRTGNMVEGTERAGE